METANLTIGHEFLESFCSCIGRKKTQKNSSFKLYDFIKGSWTMKKYSATIQVWHGKVGQQFLLETSSVIHCLRINYIIIQRNTKIPGYLNGNMTLPNKIIIISSYCIPSALLVIILNYQHLCVQINGIKHINPSIVWK